MDQTHSVEERLKVIEELLFVKQPFDIPSPDHPGRVLKTDLQIDKIDDRLDSLEDTIETLETELEDIGIKTEELGDGVLTGDEVTDRIKHYLRIYLRNALGLEVSFDDTRQTG